MLQSHAIHTYLTAVLLLGIKLQVVPKEQVSSPDISYDPSEVSLPEDPRPIRHPPVAPQIRSNSVVCSYLIVELKHLRILWIRSHRRHPPWKRIHHAIDKVEEHQVGSSHLTPDYVLPVSFDIALDGQGKIFQEFGNSIHPHVLCFAFGLGNLVFKV